VVNGVVEALEDCDDGILNGAYNHCNDDCDGPSSDYCGDGTLQAGQEVCDPSGANGETTYNLNKTDSCRWDCQAYGMYCGDGIVQAEYGEECEKDQRCSVDGQSGTRHCGDDCKYNNNIVFNHYNNLYFVSTTERMVVDVGDKLDDNFSLEAWAKFEGGLYRNRIFEKELSAPGCRKIKDYGLRVKECDKECTHKHPMQYYLREIRQNNRLKTKTKAVRKMFQKSKEAEFLEKSLENIT